MRPIAPPLFPLLALALLAGAPSGAQGPGRGPGQAPGLPPPPPPFGAPPFGAPPPFDLPPPEAAPLPPGILSAEVLPGWREGTGARVAALKLTLAPGWKTYWRVPGDAGVPPLLDFARSGNLAGLRVHWPAPDVADEGGHRSVGYHDTLVLPVRITPADPKAPVALRADLDIGICRDVCVPVQLALSADLAGRGAPDPAITAAIAAAPELRPGLARCTLAPIRDGMRVEATIDLPEASGEVALFELISHPVWVSEPEIARDGGQMLASAEFVPENGRPFALEPSDIRITVVSHAGAVEIDGCPSP